MRNSVKRAAAQIITLMESRFEEDLVDDERDWFEQEIYEILDNLFPTDTVILGQDTTVAFTPNFAVRPGNTPGTTTVENLLPKEQPSVRYKEKERSSTDVSRPKGRSNYTPRRGGDVRGKDK